MREMKKIKERRKKETDEKGKASKRVKSDYYLYGKLKKKKKEKAKMI